MKSKVTVIIATIIAVASAVPASASNLSLKQLLSSLETSSQSEKLTNQISSVLRSSKVNMEQVQCTGAKLGTRYSSLSAVAPFICRFPKNVTVTINADNFVILPSGRTTPIENAKNFHSMPKPISLYYKVTSWNWKKAP